MKTFLLLGPVRHAVAFAETPVAALTAAPDHLCMREAYDLAEPANQRLLAAQDPARYAGCFGLPTPLPEIATPPTRCLAASVDLIIPDGWDTAEQTLKHLCDQDVILDYKIQSQGAVAIHLGTYKKGSLV